MFKEVTRTDALTWLVTWSEPSRFNNGYNDLSGDALDTDDVTETLRDWDAGEPGGASIGTCSRRCKPCHRVKLRTALLDLSGLPYVNCIAHLCHLSCVAVEVIGRESTAVSPSIARLQYFLGETVSIMRPCPGITRLIASMRE